MRTVKELAGRRTVIMVAHDNRIIHEAEHFIVVEDDARICEGSAEKVCRESGFFKEMTRRGKMGKAVRI